METTRQDDPRSLYEEDFYSWTQSQADLLKAGAFDQVDVANLIEEIETLGRSERHALRSRYTVLCAHLLKTLAQSERSGRSWALTIAQQRIQVARLLEENAGLKPMRAVLFRQGYDDARKLATAETGMAMEAFSKAPPFTIEQAEDENWFPDMSAPTS